MAIICNASVNVMVSGATGTGENRNVTSFLHFVVAAHVITLSR